MEFTQQSMQKHKSTYIITQTANLQFHHPSPYKICTQTHKQQAQAHSCTQFTSFNLIYIYIWVGKIRYICKNTNPYKLSQ